MSGANGASGPALGAAVVIRDAAGRVLLVRHTYGRLNWEVPGGGSEAHESAAETAMREAVEELGVPVRLGRLVGVYWEPGWSLGRGLHHFVFTAELNGPLPSRSPATNEISDFGWFDPAELPRPMSDFTVRRITDAIGSAPPTLTAIAERTWLE